MHIGGFMFFGALLLLPCVQDAIFGVSRRRSSDYDAFSVNAHDAFTRSLLQYPRLPSHKLQASFDRIDRISDRLTQLCDDSIKSFDRIIDINNQMKILSTTGQDEIMDLLKKVEQMIIQKYGTDEQPALPFPTPG